ncbi:MAG: restriction endonuclease subunit S [Burkholderiaceae bacterium]|nr:restriction endonuclease subunit S [Burkholderiaceae bacterium]
MTTPDAVALGDVAAFVRGITFKPDDLVPVGTTGAAACMRTKNVQTELDLSDIWGIPESFVRRDDQYLLPDDILVSSANSWNLVGKCCKVPRLPWRATFGGFISVLRANPAKVEPRYLFRWFASDRTQAIVRSFGQQTTNISNLNVDRCLKLKLHLPPPSEQQRIAKILDKADALRAKRRTALAQLDTFTHSIFLDMFGDPATNPKGWPTRRLDAVCGLVNGRAFKPAEWEEDGLPIIRIQNLNDAKKPFNYTTQSLPERFRVRPGDILFSWSGTPGTSFGCFRWSGPEGWLNQHIFNVRLNGALQGDYFIAHVNLKLVELIAKAHGGVGLQHVTKGMVDETMLMVPPTHLQVEFARRVARVEKLAADQQAALVSLDSLFAALQHRAFRGELVRDEVDEVVV